MPTQNMNLPTAASARKTTRNVENLFNQALVERVFADGAISLSKLVNGPANVYIAAITQAGANAPVLTEIVNTTGETVTPTRNGAGDYTLTFSSAILTAGEVDVELSQPESTTLAEVVKAFYASTTTIGVRSGSDSATAADGILTNAILKVEIY